ncbi:MAG: ribonuclease Z [Clostridia bacterium]|nr:ribonuclease Z [Clostridia bacterium]
MKRITVAVCLDDEGGMMFNNRRQSRDRVLIAELLSSTEGRIVIHPYSAMLFGDSERVFISENPLEDAAEGDICFIEQLPIAPLLSYVGRFIIYRWNRLYPRDKSFDVDVASAGFSLLSETEFVGSSHEKITKGIYER